MNIVKSAFSSVSTFYKEMNPATLSGAIDVIAIQQPDGSIRASPFHVRFGKLKLLRPKLNRVDITVNGKPVDIHMKVGEAGEAFFVVETEYVAPDDIVTSPIQQAMDPVKEKEMSMEFLDLGEGLDPDKPGKEPANSIQYTREKVTVDANRIKAESLMADLSLDDAGECPPGKVKEIVLETEKLILHNSQPAIWRNLEDPKDHHLMAPESGVRIQKKISSQGSSSDYELSDTEEYSASPSQSWSWGWGRLPVKGEQKNVNANPNGRPELTRGQSSSDLTQQIQKFQKEVQASKNFNWEVPDEFLPEGLASSESQLEEGQGEDVFDIELSLCGEFLNQDIISPIDAEDCLDVFYKYEIKFEDFCFNPTILNDPNLIFRINGRMFRPPVALPFLISLLVYKKPLTATCMKDLIKQHCKERMQQKSKSSGSGWKSWFRRGGDPNNATQGGPQQQQQQQQQQPGASSIPSSPSMLPLSPPIVPLNPSPSPKLTSGPSGPVQGPPPLSLGGLTPSNSSQNILGPSTFNGSTSILTRSLSSDGFVTPSSSVAGLKQLFEPPKHNYVKSVRLTSDQLKSLNLQEGPNLITFTVETGACSANIYFWKHDDKIVISDIDGTITRSDTLGHIFTAVGKDWTHLGVANLYSNVAGNGYKIIYVTSRAIGQAAYTKDFLKWVEQTGGWRLPDGPCICAPDRLIAALHREVILKKPQEFKISVLSDLATLFDQNPFYAGFGNRITDAISYKTVGVPIQRIFTINPQGDIKAELVTTYKSSYLGLNEIVDQMFPPLKKQEGTKEEYNDFNYWKPTLPELELEFEEDPEEEVPSAQKGGYPFYDMGN